MQMVTKMRASPVLRFLIVGGTATLTQFVVLIALVELVGVPKISALCPELCFCRRAQLRPLTVRLPSARRPPTAQPYRALSRWSQSALTLNTVLFAVLHSLGLHYVVAQVLTTLIVLVFNYTVASRWVFSDRRQLEDKS